MRAVERAAVIFYFWLSPRKCDELLCKQLRASLAGPVYAGRFGAIGYDRAKSVAADEQFYINGASRIKSEPRIKSDPMHLDL